MKARTQQALIKAEPIVSHTKVVKRLMQHKPKSYNPAIVTAFFKEQGIPAPEFEYQFHPTRKWRFDLAWPYDLILDTPIERPMVAVEVQGGIWSSGRHNRGAAMLKEWEKLNCAAELGWRILYVQPCDLCTTEFAQTIKRALGLFEEI